MKLFDAVPSELFSVLSSPNRVLYSDALDVLYCAYRENLKIPENMLYMMLRSKLEQQLADATFDGEDIDEEELRDVSGRARFLIRKLCAKGWFEKERGEDFDEYITVPGYSSRLLELFHQLRDDSPIRGYSYVFGTYSTLKVADDGDNVYDKMAAIYSAYDNTQSLINLLQMVYHNVKHFFQVQIEMQEVNQSLLTEQQRLLRQLQNEVVDVKREVATMSSLCQTILGWDINDVLHSVIDAADTIQKAYSLFTDYNYEIFAKSIAIFARAQDATANFMAAVRDTAYKVKVLTDDLKAEQDQKAVALDNLRKNVKDYPRGLLRLKERLEVELTKKAGKSVTVDILADVLEIPESEEHWRRAVEGYLNTQKFYLLVPPEYYRDALRIYDQIKREFGMNSFGLVDIGKLRERERLEPWSDSLAKKVETDNDLARSYIDYLLGRVVCCSHVDQLRRSKTAITADGMLYQGYVVRPIRKELMDDAFIGRRAVALRIARIEAELTDIQSKLQIWAPIYQTLSRYQNHEVLFSARYIQSVVPQRQTDYLRGLEISSELKQIEEQMSHLDLFWLGEQRKIIAKLDGEIDSLGDSKEQYITDKALRENRIHELVWDILPEINQKIAKMEDRIAEEFSEDFIQKTGIPRYQQELGRLKKASVVYKNFNGRLEQTVRERESAMQKLFRARSEYADKFRPCSFRIDAMDNEEYAAEQHLLEESELPKYRAKIKAAYESAMEQFQNDFLAKLKSSIDQVQDQVKSLNRALDQAQFGTDRYKFRVDRNPDYADYYDMIMAPELMEGEAGLFAMPFQQKYGKLIDDLFSRIAMSDDTQVNARKQSELQQNIERFTDFRTYLKFDLETIDQNGSKQMLSQTLNTKSGGETQTPFYIAVLASFAQIYQVNNLSGLVNNTVRLVVFDEAFNKMDSERIVESVRLLRKMGLQAIICTPPDKLPDIMPLADRTLLVSKDKYQMHILTYGKRMECV